MTGYVVVRDPDFAAEVPPVTQNITMALIVTYRTVKSDKKINVGRSGAGRRRTSVPHDVRQTQPSWCPCMTVMIVKLTYKPDEDVKAEG